jgi:hypothetical protein
MFEIVPVRRKAQRSSGGRRGIILKEGRQNELDIFASIDRLAALFLSGGGSR